MAAALVEHRTNRGVRARSAGSHPKPLHPHAVRAMARRGIDISSRKPTHFDRLAGKPFDRVITLCDKVREICPDFPGSPSAVHWSLADPAAEPNGEAFEHAANELESRIDLLITELAQPSERSRNVDN